MRCAFLQFLQCFKVLPLLGRQRLRQLYVHRRIEIPVFPRFASHRHAVSLQAEDLAVLGVGRDLQPERPARQRRNLHLAAEHRGCERDRDVRVEVAALPLEAWMRREPDAQVEVARLPAARTLLALARDAYSRSVADARRNAHVDRASVAIMLDRQPPRRAVVSALEAELDLVFDVASGARPAGAPAAGARLTSAKTATAEERLEEIREGVLAPEHLVHLFLRHRAIAGLAAASEVRVPRARLTRIESLARAGLFVGTPVGAELVVLLALGGIAEHLVRLGQILEARLRSLVARIDVGVVLARQLPVRLLDLLLGRGFGDAERRVVVLEVHSQSKPSMRLNSSSS